MSDNFFSEHFHIPINCYYGAITLFCVNHIPARVCFMDVLQLITARPLKREKKSWKTDAETGAARFFVIAEGKTSVNYEFTNLRPVA